MTRTKNFFWLSSAEKFAEELKGRGFFPDIFPAHTFGPRGCFSWGWSVVWLEVAPAPSLNPQPTTLNH